MSTSIPIEVIGNGGLDRIGQVKLQATLVDIAGEAEEDALDIA